MNATYIECPECHKRALSVATRCPQCGFEFPSQPLRRSSSGSDFGWLRPLLVVVVVVAATAGLVTMVMRRTPSGRVSTPAPSASPTQKVDTATAAASPSAPPVAPSTGAAGPGANASAGSLPTRRFAKTWTNVRSRRSTTGDVIGVLLPGDTVIADSLARGWYRVTMEGRVMGYVYQAMLVTEPPATTPLR